MKLKPVYDLICEYEPCGVKFTATRSNAVWCSKRCRDRVKYAQNRDQFKRKSARSGNPCELCARDRGPNHNICQTCVRATRGVYDESLAHVAF